MMTSYTIFRVGQEPERASIDWPEEPGYDRLKRMICPLLGDDEPLEHVAVLHDGERRDMFVSELGAVALTTRGPLPRNEAATAIYRNNTLTRYPETDPEDIPAIYGTAILFDRIVWF